LKILHIIHGLNSGGAERQLIELLKGLVKKDNIEAEVILLSDAIDYTYVYDINVNIHILKRKYKKDFGIFKKIYNICKNFNPDVIHSWEPMCSIYSMPIAKLIGAKFINGMIRFSPSNFTIFHHKWFLATRFTFMFSDYILSNSYAGLRSYNAKGSKSVCIHNGFDFARIKNIQKAEYIKTKHNINSINTVGMVARFKKKRKDYETFIGSAKNILKKRNDVTFITIGDGETLQYCMDLVPLEYRENIRFLGKQTDVESIINIFDIGVLVSYEEGISNSIMEYMALEKPVIATNHGGNEEIVIDNKTGFLIKEKDIQGLTEKIEYLLDNKDIAKAMGRAGRERLEKEFSLDKMTEAYINLYAKCFPAP
jgi:glycosyltransferase involved in cell wall biosynthesis